MGLVYLRFLSAGGERFIFAFYARRRLNMEILRTAAEITRFAKAAQQAGKVIGLVPTMGAQRLTVKMFLMIGWSSPWT